jgi:hypothetical protein
MKKFKNYLRPRREYRFVIVDHKKPLKSGETVSLKYLSLNGKTNDSQ